MSRLSNVLTQALLECLSAPPGERGDRTVEQALERAARRVKRIPKPPKPDTALNANARRRLEQLSKKD